jgi:hypothetical protein
MIQAEVSVEKAGKVVKVARANRLGQVALADLPAGDYKLKITAEGFAPQELRVKVQTNGPNQMLSIQMSPAK